MLDRLPNEPSAAERERRAAELIGQARELIPLIDRIERERRIPEDVLGQTPMGKPPARRH